MKSLELIKDNHEKIKLKYPRPTVPCDICKSDLIVCYGKKITKPYLRHKLPVDHNPQSESWEHQEAKRLLCEYLNAGGKCLFLRRCWKETSTTESLVGLKYQSEVSFLSSILDVAGMNELDSVVFNIEVKQSHRTSNLEDRNKIIWVEVDANEVISKLFIPDRPPIIELMDIRTLYCCQAQILPRPNIPSAAMQPRSSIATTISFPHTSRSIEDCPSVKEVEALCELSEDLGYCFEDDQVCCYRQAAMTGKYRRRLSSWNTYSYRQCQCRDRTCDLCLSWEIFLEMGRCLNCNKLEDISYGRPFCRSCYGSVKQDEGKLSQWYYISEDLKNELRSKMSWIKALPKTDDFLSTCSLCFKDLHIDAASHNDNPYVWWFGENRRLCWTCLDNRLFEDGVYDLILSPTWKKPDARQETSPVNLTSEDLIMKLINEARKK